jgi:hypothetical protein
MVSWIRSGFTARLLITLVLSGLGIQGLWQLWSGGLRPVETKPSESAEVSRAGYVMLAFDQVVRSVNDYVRTGDRRDREEFDGHVRRLSEVVAALEMGSDTAERRIGGMLRGHAARAEALALAVLKLADPAIGVSSATVATLHQISELREQALLAASDLRELDERKTKKGQAGSWDGLVTGGFVTLGVSLAGAVGLARFTVV